MTQNDVINKLYEAILTYNPEPASNTMEEVVKFKPNIVGMLTLLTKTIINQQKVMEKLRDKMKVIASDALITNQLVGKIGTDDYAENAMETANIVGRLLES